MIPQTLCQAASVDLEFVKYIIGGLAVTVVSLAIFIKWMFSTIIAKAENGIEKGWIAVEKMHKEGVERFDKSLDLQMQTASKMEVIQIQNSSKMEAIQKSCDQNRDAVHTLNTLIKCKKRTPEDQEENF